MELSKQREGQRRPTKVIAQHLQKHIFQVGHLDFSTLLMVDALLTITVQRTAGINTQTEASRAKKVAKTKVMDVLISPSTNTAAEVIVPRKRR